MSFRYTTTMGLARGSLLDFEVAESEGDYIRRMEAQSGRHLFKIEFWNAADYAQIETFGRPTITLTKKATKSSGKPLGFLSISSARMGLFSNGVEAGNNH
jgi:hypothetical protein